MHKKIIKDLLNGNYDLNHMLHIQEALSKLLMINKHQKKILQDFNVFDIILRYKESLFSLKKINYNTYINCKVLHELFIRIAKEEIIGMNIFAEWEKLIQYLQIAMGYETVEQLRIVLLDKKKAFIRDEIMTKGTVDQSAVYNREIIAVALKYNVKDILVVHNHPSGDCTPSSADQDVTATVNFACNLNDIKLIDHLIIGQNTYFSFINSARNIGFDTLNKKHKTNEIF